MRLQAENLPGGVSGSGLLSVYLFNGTLIPLNISYCATKGKACNGFTLALRTKKAAYLDSIYSLCFIGPFKMNIQI